MRNESFYTFENKMENNSKLKKKKRRKLTASSLVPQAVVTITSQSKSQF